MNSENTCARHWISGILLALLFHISGLLLTLSSGVGVNLINPQSSGTASSMSIILSAAPSNVSKTPKTSSPVLHVASKKLRPYSQKKKQPPVRTKTHTVRSAAPSETNSESFIKHAATHSTTSFNRHKYPENASTNTTSSGFGINTPLKAYRQTIHRILMRAKRYPSSARIAGEQGSVVVSFRIHPTGEVSNINIATPSPYWSLNREGSALIRRVKRFPPIPAEVSALPMSFTVTIPFRLH